MWQVNANYKYIYGWIPLLLNISSLFSTEPHQWQMTSFSQIYMILFCIILWAHGAAQQLNSTFFLLISSTIYMHLCVTINQVRTSCRQVLTIAKFKTIKLLFVCICQFYFLQHQFYYPIFILWITCILYVPVPTTFHFDMKL